jgi:hypothetical protein
VGLFLADVNVVLLARDGLDAQEGFGYLVDSSDVGLKSFLVHICCLAAATLNSVLRGLLEYCEALLRNGSAFTVLPRMREPARRARDAGGASQDSFEFRLAVNTNRAEQFLW